MSDMSSNLQTVAEQIPDSVGYTVGWFQTVSQ